MINRLVSKKNGPSLKISVILPTLNRVSDLQKALDSIMRQSYLPSEIIIVDQSTGPQTRELAERMALDQAGREVDFKYIYEEEKSSAKARNRGLDRAAGDLVCLLDDDTVLYRDYFEQVVRYFNQDPQTGALSGNVIVHDKPRGFKWAVRKTLLRVFLLSDFKGRMTVSGFGYPVYEREIEKVMPVELMPGCNMNFRGEAIGSERFDEWFTGYSFREDAEFSYRISKKTKIVMIPQARLYHNHSPQNRLNAAALKKMEIRNYYYCFKKHRPQNVFSRALFMWSLLGINLIDFIEVLTNREPAKLSKFRAAVESTMELASAKEGDSR